MNANEYIRKPRKYRGIQLIFVKNELLFNGAYLKLNFAQIVFKMQLKIDFKFKIRIP